MLGGGSGFKTIQVLLTANNSNLKSTLLSSGAQIDAFSKKVKSSNESLFSTANVAKGAAAGVLAIGAGLAYSAVKAAEFDKSMRNVNSLAKLGPAAFKALEASVVSMSTKLPQSATTLAEGLYDITSSGFKGADAMKILQASALSASAGLTTTAVSARAISATLNAYGLKASDAADVSDVLFQTVNAGVISFEELSQHLGDVVGGAAAASVGIDQVGTAIATMTLAGIGGAEATTSLNQLLSKILQPSKALAAVYEQLGYESGEAALKQDGLRGVLTKVSAATGGSVTSFLQLFPEIRAARGALALTANEGKNYANVAAQIEDKTARAGSTQRVFAEQMKAASNQLALLKNQADAAAIKLGLKLLPALSSLIGGTHDVGAGVGALIGKLSSEFGPGLQNVGKILEELTSIFGTAAGAVWDLVKPFAGLALAGIAATFNAIASAVESITGPISENRAAVIALTAAFLAFYAASKSALIVSSLGLAFNAVTGAAEGLTFSVSAARLALVSFIASAVPFVAIAAVVYAGAKAWDAYQDQVKKTDVALKSASKAQDSMKVSTMGAELTKLSKTYDDLQKTVSKGRQDSFLDKIGIGLPDLLDKSARAGDAASKGILKAQVAALQTRAGMIDLGKATIEFAESIGKIDPSKAKQLMDGLAAGDPDSLEQIDGLVKDLQPQLTKTGTSAREFKKALEDAANGDTSGLDKIGGSLRELNTAGGQAASAQDDVVKAFLQTGDAGKSAADAADDLKKALDDLTGAAIDVDAAGIKWRAGLVDLESQLKKNKGALLAHTAAGDASRTEVQKSVGNLKDQLVAMAQNGAGADKLAKRLSEGRTQMIAAGDAAGVNAGDMKKLLAQYKLTPALVKTLIQQYGGDDVKSKLKDVKKAAKDADATNPKINVSTPGAPKANNTLLDIITNAKKADDGKVKVQTSAPGASEAADKLSRMNSLVDSLNGKHATSFVDVVAKIIGAAKNADGGIIAFAGGGSLPDQAKIQGPMGGGGLVQWAESETGGEAFIPMGASKRGRSTEILGSVASSFGYTLTPTESYANGGRRKKGKSGPDNTPSSAESLDVLQARADLRDLQNQYAERIKKGKHKGQLKVTGLDRQILRAQIVKAQKDLADAIAGKSDSSDPGSVFAASADPGATVSSYVASLGDSGAITAAGLSGALSASLGVAQKWGQDLTTVAAGAGADVVKSLQGMGDEGAKIIAALASGTVADMQAMAAQLHAIQFTNYATSTASDLKAQQAFETNLQALVKAGRADLAGTLAQMGYESAGGIAAGAVGQSADQLAALAANLQASSALSDTASTDALVLAGVLQANPGLGIIGLATKSGKSVSDVVGLLQKYASTFSSLPTNATSQINADQALLTAGKQPSGLANGGIIPSSATTRGMYYRWAEPSSGGESLIPLGNDNRQRALDLWDATGRMIGARSGGGGTMTVVQPGAVSLSIDASGQPLTAAEVQGIAKRATDDAMTSLVRVITQGKRS